MEGAAWQRLCLQVLLQEFRADLVVVPDRDQGDAGIECFTANGHAYQCYSPLEPLTVAQRYAKQRNKMTTDVGTFIRNHQKLCALLGDVKISHWILLVPVVDSRKILEHAVGQSERLRQSRIAHATPAIRVLVHTLDHYETSHAAIINNRLASLNIPKMPEPDYASIPHDDIEAMRGKLAKVPTLSNEGSRQRLAQSLLRSFIGGRDRRDFIRDHYVELAEGLEHSLLDLEERLDGQYVIEGHSADRLLSEVRNAAERRTRAAISATDRDARIIAEGQIADWLMHCTLDFLEELADD